MTGATGSASIQIRLDIGFGKRKPWRTAIHNASHGRTVTFAKGSYREQFSKRIASHINPSVEVS
jgi:hypothetical protein